VGYLKVRLQLAQDILDSVASEGVAPPLTEAQRAKPFPARSPLALSVSTPSARE
jgi:hypothetical protein